MDINRYVAIFDSGIGGLSVLQALRRLMPAINIIYYADNLNAPYGDKTPAEIIHLTDSVLSKLTGLTDLDLSLVIAGCHTSSYVAMPHLEPKYSRKYATEHGFACLTTIPATLSSFSQSGFAESNSTQRGDIHARKTGILTTPATAKHINFPKQFNPIIIPCPGLASLIEDYILNPTNLIQERNLRAKLQIWLEPFTLYREPLLTPDSLIDTLIYGCTHYVFIDHLIASMLPKDVRRIDPATQLAIHAQDILLSRTWEDALQNSPNSTTLRLVRGKSLFYASKPCAELELKIKRILNLAEIDLLAL